MSKKILIACVLVMTMILSFATIGSAAGAPTVIIGNVEGAAGDEVEVEVNLKNNPGLVVLTFYVRFDQTVMKLVSRDIPGDVVPDNATGKVTSTVNKNGQIKIDLGDDVAEENFEDDGLLATLTFELLTDVAATDANKQPWVGITSYANKTLKDYAYDINEDNIDFTFEKEAPAGTSKQAWLGYTNYADGSYLAIAKFEAGSTAYGINFDNYDFVADGANDDNIFAIEIQDLDAAPTGVTAFAR